MTSNQQSASDIAGGQGTGSRDIEYISIWKLLKDYVRDCEITNNEKYMDSAWQRIKQLETDLKNAMSNNINYEIDLQTSGNAKNPYELSRLVYDLQKQLDNEKTDAANFLQSLANRDADVTALQTALTAASEREARLREACELARGYIRANITTSGSLSMVARLDKAIADAKEEG